MQQNYQDKQAKLQREYYCRTQSERILDRHLNKKGEIHKLLELEQEIYGDSRKKVKTEESEKDLLPHVALNQVLKFITVEQKAFKAINKIKTLLVQFTNSFYPEHILQTLYQLTQCNIQFKKEEIRKDCLEIFETLSEKSSIHFQKEMITIFELFSYELSTHNKLFTDDQFQLNAQLKDLLKLMKQIREIQEIQGDNHVYPEGFKDKKLDREYEFEYSDEFKLIITSWERRNTLRQEFLLSSVSDLITFYKQPWAKASVSQFMNNLFHNNKDIFTQIQQEKLTNYMSEMQGLKTQFINQSSKADLEAGRLMKDYLKPNHDVIDGRGTAIVTDNLNTWASKQCGL